MTTVRVLREQDVEATAGILAASFIATPPYLVVFPESANREARLSDLFARNLRLHLPFHCSHVLLEDDEVVGTVSVRPPEGVDLSLWKLFRTNLLGFALKHGMAATRRLVRLSAEYTALESEVNGRAPHWYVHMMGIVPRLQGRGLGSELLRRVLEEKTRGRSEPIALNTNNFENVRFYARAGFRMIDKRDMPDATGEGAYPCWSMSCAGPYAQPASEAP
jgi:GNAT superfamily N-acetyltransferase